MKLLVISDLHVDAGRSVFGEDRLSDAERILGEIMDSDDAKTSDALLFLGDMSRTASPEPAPYSVVQRAFARFGAKPIYLLMGNHDYMAGPAKNLHVVAVAVGGEVIERPSVYQIGNNGQVGLAFLPWTPPIRLFGATRDARAMNIEVAGRLHEVARGLAAKLRPDRPRILLLHWLVAGEKLASGQDVVSANEPLLEADVLEGAGFDLVLAGHNHVPQQLSSKVWSVGPPMRGGFGEADVPVGYMVVGVREDGTWDIDARHVPVKDRELITLDLDPNVAFDEALLASDFKGAVVRIRYSCRDDQQAPMLAAVQSFTAALLEHGAHRVLPPQVTVERARKERERLEVDVDPHRALDTYLRVQGINGDVADAAKREAVRFIGEPEIEEEEPW